MNKDNKDGKFSKIPLGMHFNPYRLKKLFNEFGWFIFELRLFIKLYLVLFMVGSNYYLQTM